MEPEYSAFIAGKFFSGNSSGQDALDHVTDKPHRGAHRRAQSDIAFRLPDEFLFDIDMDFPLIDVPSLTEENNCRDGESRLAIMDTGKSAELRNAVKEEGVLPISANDGPGGGGSHLRSLSMDTAFYDGLTFTAGPTPPVTELGRRPQHRRSGSVDGLPGASSSSFEEGLDSLVDVKKAMPPDKLAELSLIDPRRAKRILANRQSAARSKEWKVLYTSELQKKVQMLQTEATTLSAQLTLLQRDTTGLTAENKELKIRLQAMEQQAQLRNALNDALREEVQRLKLATGQIPSMMRNDFDRTMPHPNASFFCQSQQLRNTWLAHRFSIPIYLLKFQMDRPFWGELKKKTWSLPRNPATLMIISRHPQYVQDECQCLIWVTAKRARHRSVCI